MTGLNDHIGFFDRVMAASRPLVQSHCIASQLPIDGDDVNLIPPGAYVVATMKTGETLRVMRTRGDSLYDITSGGG